MGLELDPFAWGKNKHWGCLRKKCRKIFECKR